MLTLLAILIAVLVALAIVAAVVPRAILTWASASIAGLIAVLALATTAGFETTEPLTLPLGPAGAAMHLALDPLGSAFLLLVFIAAKPCALFVEPDAPLPALPASLAGLALTLLAADAFTLLLGLLLLALATRESPRTATFSIVCLVAAFALATPTTATWLNCDFAAIRAAPPEGWRAAAVLLLVLLAAGSQAAQTPRTPLSAVASTTIGVYLLMRVLLDLCGPTQPLWWGIPLLIVGAIAALAGTLRAALATTLHAVLATGTLHQLGLATIGIGIALLARAVDLPDVALLALDATWLLLTAHVLCRTLLVLGADAVATGAGTRRLDRLGGIIHGMPITSLCILAGLFGIAIVPPGLGFAGFWLLFQSLLAAARIGGFSLQLIIAIVAALTALSAGLSVLAAVRMFGVAFLGRPRTPRTAVAEEAPRLLRIALIGLAALTGLLAVLPAIALLPAAPALTRLANGGTDTLAFALTLRPGAEAPGYPPIAIAALLTIVAYAVYWLLYRSRSPASRREAAWSGGFAPPPAWMPFGDPATQSGPASFVEPLRRFHTVMVGGGRPPTPDASSNTQSAGWTARATNQLLRIIRRITRVSAHSSIAATLIVIVLAVTAWLVAP